MHKYNDDDFGLQCADSDVNRVAPAVLAYQPRRVTTKLDLADTREVYHNSPVSANKKRKQEDILWILKML